MVALSIPGISEFQVLMAWLWLQVQNFMTNAELPFFGRFFVWAILLWILFGVGWLISITFGWEMGERMHDASAQRRGDPRDPRWR